METGLLFSSLGWARLGLHNALCLSLGLAVDYHNERLYWADAKLSVIGSIRLNGTDPIVAADSKRGQPLRAASASPALGPLIFPTESKALPSICHPPHPGAQQSCGAFPASPPSSLALDSLCTSPASSGPLAHSFITPSFELYGGNRVGRRSLVNVGRESRSRS